MKPSPLRLARPRSLAEALALLAEHGDDAKVLAGGQSLMPLINFRLAAPAVLVDLGQVPALALVDVAEGACASARCARSATSSATPRRSRRARCWGSPCPTSGHVATRNRGTVGGSIAHADAAAELPLVLQTLAGAVEVTGPSGARLVPVGGVLRLAPDELPRAGRARDRGALPRQRRRLGRGLRRGRAAPWRLRRVRAGVCAPRRGRRRHGGPHRRRRRRPTGPCACRPPRRSLVGTRCEPEALARRAERGARGRRPERRHARLRGVPAPPHGRARRARPRSAPTRWRLRREGARAHGQRPARARARRRPPVAVRLPAPRRSACAARTSAASTASAAPARCGSTAARCAPA